MSNQIIDALSDLFSTFMEKYPEGARSEYSSQWLSECIVSHRDDTCLWQPVLRSVRGDFSNVEQSLKLVFDHQVVEFYARYWSGDLEVDSDFGRFLLLQNWNQDDFEQLQSNLIGHILMKRKLKQPETLFIGLTEHEDINLCVVNETGEVVLEPVGLEPSKVLAPDLATFLKQLSV